MADILGALPVAHGKPRQIGSAQGGGLDAAGAHNLAVQNVALELHEEIVCAGAAVHLQVGDADAGVLLHGLADIIGLVGQGFQGGPHQMGPAESTGQAHDGAPGVLVPVGRAQARKGWDHIAPGGVLHAAGVFQALSRVGQHAQLVPEPLDGGAGHEDAALQGVFHMVLVAHGDGGHQAVVALHRLPAGVHQHKAAGAVGVLHLPGQEAALAEQGTLLVPRRAGDGDLSAVKLKVCCAVDTAGGLDLRQDAFRHVQQLQQLLVPAELMDIVEHGAAGVGLVGDMDRAAGELPDQPGVDGAEEQLAFFRPLPGPGGVVQQPFDLGAGEIGVGHKAGLFADGVAVAFGLQLVDDGGGAAALPDDGVGDGLAGGLIPDNGGLPLVGDADGGNILRGDAQLFHGGPGDLQGGGPDLLRVVLHPAGVGEDLAEFLLGSGADVSRMVKKNAAGAGGTLVKGHDVFHCNSPSVRPA